MDVRSDLFEGFGLLATKFFFSQVNLPAAVHRFSLSARKRRPSEIGLESRSNWVTGDILVSKKRNWGGGRHLSAADLTNGGAAVLFCCYGIRFWQEDLGLAPGFNVCCKIGFLVLLEGEVDDVFEFEVKRIQIVAVWLTVGDLRR